MSKALRSRFRAELLNRLDESLIIYNLKAKELRQIVELQVKRPARRLDDKKLGLELDGDALGWLDGVDYDPVYGAHPLQARPPARTENAESQSRLACTLPAFHTNTVEVEAEGEASRLHFSQGEEARLPALVCLKRRPKQL